MWRAQSEFNVIILNIYFILILKHFDEYYSELSKGNKLYRVQSQQVKNGFYKINEQNDMVINSECQMIKWIEICMNKLWFYTPWSMEIDKSPISLWTCTSTVYMH